LDTFDAVAEERCGLADLFDQLTEIGRASCRERVSVRV
jgi:hypothetical protein